MPRIKLLEQTMYEFRHELRVRISDLNVARHVGNEQMAALIHEARHQLLKTLGLNEGNLGDGKTALIIADMVINFKAEAFVDDSLLIESHINEIDDKSFRIFHRLSKNGQIIALAETGIIAYEYLGRKMSSIPGEFLQALNRYRETSMNQKISH